MKFFSGSMSTDYPSILASTMDYGEVWLGSPAVKMVPDPMEEVTCEYCGTTQYRSDALDTQGGSRRPGCVGCGASIPEATW